ncbi:hypothetical protein [uncultured Dokdonia sp.]|uniref:hypothetical protein n=1 Tax=uncultured Dokdonia sp. TaxID=575653 RepID=UPI00261296DA|nr:hypothetical protein [uncultured Dokdonia sp.]
MKTHYLILICSLCMISCSKEENAVDIVFNNVRTGAVLRTLEIENLTFDTSAPDRPISIRLEHQDEQRGDLLDTVELFLSFEDRTSENGDRTEASRLFKTLSRNDFDLTAELPITNIVITTQELLDFFGFSTSDIQCTDRFVLDVKLCLTNGLCFTNLNSIGPIISLGGRLNSPFTYDIYVVDGVDDQLFIGSYSHTSIQDGFQGPTIITPEVIEITTNRPNTRRFEIFRDDQDIQGGLFLRAEVEFVIACDQAILTRYVRSAIICGFGVEGDIHVLLGPEENLNETVSISDETVFSLKFLEAFEGNDGFCDWPLTSSEVRFSKQ